MCLEIFISARRVQGILRYMKNVPLESSRLSFSSEKCYLYVKCKYFVGSFKSGQSEFKDFVLITLKLKDS